MVHDQTSQLRKDFFFIVPWFFRTTIISRYILRIKIFVIIQYSMKYSIFPLPSVPCQLALASNFRTVFLWLYLIHSKRHLQHINMGFPLTQHPLTQHPLTLITEKRMFHQQCSDISLTDDNMHQFYNFKQTEMIIEWSFCKGRDAWLSTGQLHFLLSK